MNPEQPETTLYQDGGITVTRSRFIVGSQTFAVRGITSVRHELRPRDIGASGVLMIFGVVVTVVGCFISIGVAIAGVILLGMGIYFAAQRPPTYAVVLTTAAGEVRAYESTDWDHICHIIEALNQAIISQS